MMLTNTNRKLVITCVYECRVSGNPAANSKAVEGSKPAMEQQILHVLFVQKPVMNSTDSSTSLAIGECQEIVIIYSYTIQITRYEEEFRTRPTLPNSTLVQRSLSKCVTIIFPLG